MSAAKVERLLTLLQVLLDARVPIPSRTIRARVPGYSDDDVAYRRAFERDKAELGELLGHPIRSETIPGSDPPEEGYRLRPSDAFLRDPGLDPDERRAVAVAASAVRLAGVDPRRATSKLGADAPDDPDGDALPLSTELPADASVVTLFDAVARRRVATFTYKGEERRVHPLRLRFTKGRWYLSAFDLGRDAERLFRLDRVEGEVVAGPPGAFADPPPPSPTTLDEPWTLGDGPTQEVRIAVDAARAEAARLAAQGARVTEGADGGIVLALDVRHLPALRSFVLGFGEGAVVLSPPDVRDEVVGWLTAIAERGR